MCNQESFDFYPSNHKNKLPIMIFRTKTKQPLMIDYTWVKEGERWIRKFTMQERRELPDEIWDKIINMSKVTKGPPVDSWGYHPDGKLKLTPSFEHLIINLSANMNVNHKQNNFVKSYKLNRIMRYIMINLRIGTYRKIIEHYSKCNCCYRHMVNRPEFKSSSCFPFYINQQAKLEPKYQACLKPGAKPGMNGKKGICECNCRSICRIISAVPDDEYAVDIYDDHDDIFECSKVTMGAKYTSYYEFIFKWINSVSIHKLYLTSVDMTAPGYEGTYKISLYDIAKSGNMRLVRQVLGAPEFKREKLEHFIGNQDSWGEQYYYILD